MSVAKIFMTLSANWFVMVSVKFLRELSAYERMCFQSKVKSTLPAGVELIDFTDKRFYHRFCLKNQFWIQTLQLVNWE